MDQDLLKSSLSGLERKILVLLNDHKTLKDEIRSLKLENHELRTDLRKRDEQLSNFKNQSTRVLVATDIAARGIDVDELEMVINFEIPTCKFVNMFTC